MQLLLAVGAVRVTHSAVDYKSYLCQEADSHSEGVCFLFSTAIVYPMVCTSCGSGAVSK